MSAKIAIALVHYPVLDGKKEVVTSAITNLDVHDLARSARTYGCTDYFIVHPIEAQRALVDRICQHWTEGSSSRRIPDRKIALALVRTTPSLEDAIERLGGRSAVEVWITAARALGGATTFSVARERILHTEKNVLIVFGTAWGLAPRVVDDADITLEPINAECRTEYNHLSVRAACAIALDRLCGARAQL